MSIPIILSEPTPGHTTSYSLTAIAGKELNIDIGHGRMLSIEFLDKDQSNPYAIGISCNNPSDEPQDIVVLHIDPNANDLQMFTWENPDDEIPTETTVPLR